MAPVVQLGVQEVYVVEEHFHCDDPEQEKADRQVGGSEQEQADRQDGGPEQEQADRQVGGHYHWAVELEQGHHGLPLVTTVLVVFSFYDSGVPPDVMLLEVVVSPPLHSGMVKPFYLFL